MHFSLLSQSLFVHSFVPTHDSTPKVATPKRSTASKMMSRIPFRSSTPNSSTKTPRYVPTSAAKRLGLAQHLRETAKSPGRSPLSQAVQQSPDSAADVHKPLPSPPVAQIIDPLSSPLAKRTLIDAEVVGASTPEDWPALQPENTSPTPMQRHNMPTAKTTSMMPPFAKVRGQDAADIFERTPEPTPTTQVIETEQIGAKPLPRTPVTAQGVKKGSSLPAQSGMAQPSSFEQRNTSLSMGSDTTHSDPVVFSAAESRPKSSISKHRISKMQPESKETDAPSVYTWTDWPLREAPLPTDPAHNQRSNMSRLSAYTTNTEDSNTRPSTAWSSDLAPLIGTRRMRLIKNGDTTEHEPKPSPSSKKSSKKALYERTVSMITSRITRSRSSSSEKKQDLSPSLLPAPSVPKEKDTKRIKAKRSFKNLFKHFRKSAPEVPKFTTFVPEKATHEYSSLEEDFAFNDEDLNKENKSLPIPPMTEARPETAPAYCPPPYIEDDVPATPASSGTCIRHPAPVKKEDHAPHEHNEYAEQYGTEEMPRAEQLIGTVNTVLDRVQTLSVLSERDVAVQIAENLVKLTDFLAAAKNSAERADMAANEAKGSAREANMYGRKAEEASKEADMYGRKAEEASREAEDSVRQIGLYGMRAEEAGMRAEEAGLHAEEAAKDAKDSAKKADMYARHAEEVAREAYLFGRAAMHATEEADNYGREAMELVNRLRLLTAED